MNAAHYHLILNHIPIFTTLIGILILVWGMIKKSQSINNIAFVLLIIGAMASYVALETGDGAEEVLEDQSISNTEMHKQIENHEHKAETSLWFAVIAGGLSVIGLFGQMFDQKKRNLVNGATLLLAAISLGFLIYTAYLGGAIRHTETYSDNAILQPAKTIIKLGNKQFNLSSVS